MPLPADTKKKRLRAAPILVAVGALVAACSRLPIELPSWPKRAEAPPAVEPAKVPPKPAAKASVPARPEAPARPPALVGLSEAETQRLLGPPAEIDQRPPGKVWIYAKDECRLAVHLFPDVSGAGFYALDYTARDGDREGCLSRAIEAARRKG